MKRVLRPPLRLLQALLLGLTLLCTIAMPAVTLAQELHELEHALAEAHDAPGAAHQAEDADDGGLAEVLHAPHCCVHVAVLPQFELPTALVPPTDAPRSPPSSISPAPRSRLMRPPIHV